MRQQNKRRYINEETSWALLGSDVV